MRRIGRLVGNDHDVEVVDLGELGRFGLGRAGHARELLVHAEVVLEGDGRERLVLALDLHAFLGFDGLVQAVAPAAARHQAAGELVDDDDLAVLDHVVARRACRGRARAAPAARGGAAACWPGRRGRRAAGGARAAARPWPCRSSVSVAGLVLLVDDVVARRFEALAVLALDLALVHLAALQLRDDAVDFVVEVGRFLGRARDDQRRARLVDQDGVDFVDDREVMAALDHARRGRTSCCRAGSRSRTRCWCRR